MTRRGWCAARNSKRCAADSGVRREGLVGEVEVSRGIPVDELLTCVACGVLICRPCSVDLPNGEVECPQCARADVRGREVSRG